MIEEAVFGRAWKRLEDRWGKQPPGMARDYFEFLSAHLDTEGFTAAATAVWATREFFPRPADFLLVERERMWQAALRIRDLAVKAKRTGGETTWPEDLGALPKPANLAVWALGGPFGLAESKLPSHQLRREFFMAFEEAVCSLAAEHGGKALGGGIEVPRIGSGGKTVARSDNGI